MKTFTCQDMFGMWKPHAGGIRPRAGHRIPS